MMNHNTDFLETDNTDTVLQILVQPGASASGVSGIQNGRLKIKIAAAPEGGKANKEVIRFLSKKLNIPKSSIKLTRGHKAREKTVQIRALSTNRIQAALLPE